MKVDHFHRQRAPDLFLDLFPHHGRSAQRGGAFKRHQPAVIFSPNAKHPARLGKLPVLTVKEAVGVVFFAIYRTEESDELQDLQYRKEREKLWGL